MPFPILTVLLALGSPQSPQVPAAPVVQAPVRVPETSAVRTDQLRVLVEEAERALAAGDHATVTLKADAVDVLTVDWLPDLLRKPEVQALLQRLKDVLDQVPAGAGHEPDPGLKAQEEIVSLSGEDLRAQLEKVRLAEQGATYDFPIDLNDKVLTWVNLFSTTKRGFMENALGRASMYLPMIRQVFAEEGIPSDLAYLAVIESGFRNEAKSRARAVGMWQFIRSTGRIYGLTGNAWLEERRDPIKATRAAARYLRRLYEISGDWYLAASSYNAGPLTLERAAQNMGTRNFWDLARSRWLRTETKNYVPELCAAILVGRNPERYGVRVDLLPPYAYETVTVPSMTGLPILARCAATDVATLKALNPELLRGSTPPGTYHLRVPPGKALEVSRQLAAMPAGKRLDFQRYTVRKGDTLAKVAKRFKVTPDDLLGANGITSKDFRPGKRLQVPPPPLLALDPKDLRSRSETRTVLGDHHLDPLPALPTSDSSRGETTPLQSVQGASAAAPVPAPQAEPQSHDYRAKPGDTLAKLARARRIPLGDLLRLNPEAAGTLHPGDTVRLPGAPIQEVPISQRIHQVKAGETLETIARQHGVTPADLRRWNRLKGDRIQAGQRLRLAPR